MKKETIEKIKTMVKDCDYMILPYAKPTLEQCYELYDNYNIITISSFDVSAGLVADKVFYRNCPTFSLEKED